MPKLSILITAALIFFIVTSTFFPLVYSSTGYIRINRKSSSTPNQQVQVGGNINLYFGEVTWSGAQFYLLMSTDGFPQLSQGDSRYTALFDVTNVTAVSGTSTYTYQGGSWTVGQNWVNGTSQNNLAEGNYWIKAFDGATTSVAVTDTNIIVCSVVYSADLIVSPVSGPGGISAQFTGSNYPSSSPVTISYYDTKYGAWNYFTNTSSDSTGKIACTSEITDLGKSVGIGDNTEAYTKVSYRAQIYDVVYSYVDYNQYSRGLKVVGNQIANGLYGNGTNLASTVNVKPGDNLALSGKWFHPGVIYIRWDSTTIVGTVTGDQWRNAQIIGTSTANSAGSFDTAVTIPQASAGEHYISIEDSQTKVIIKITLSLANTPTPNPTITPPPTPTPAPVLKAESIVEISCKSSTSYFGYKVEINGNLSSGGTPISGTPILLSYSVTGGSSWSDLTLVYTGSNGDFSAVWMPLVSGSYQIKAKWDGNSAINEASKIVSLVSTPYAEQNVFSVTSNSTVSALSFNSVRNELSFGVTGSTGTIGFVDIGIAKNLVLNITDLQVFLDGIMLEYTTTATSDSWFLHFNYTHSTHNVIIELGQNVSPYPSPTATATPTQTPTPTLMPTSTPTPSSTPTPLPTPTSTPTPTPIPASTQTPKPIVSSSPSLTPSPSPTIPEFSSVMLLLVVIIATLIVFIIAKKRH